MPTSWTPSGPGRWVSWSCWYPPRLPQTACLPGFGGHRRSPSSRWSAAPARFRTWPYKDYVTPDCWRPPTSSGRARVLDHPHRAAHGPVRVARVAATDADTAADPPSTTIRPGCNRANAVAVADGTDPCNVNNPVSYTHLTLPTIYSV